MGLHLPLDRDGFGGLRLGFCDLRRGKGEEEDRVLGERVSNIAAGNEIWELVYFCFI